MKSLLRLSLSFALLFATANVRAAYVQAQLPVTQLPTNHVYQQTLRSYLATLKADDYASVTQCFTVVTPTSRDSAYALWLLTLFTGASFPGEITLPPEAFTLAMIESRKGLAMPAAPHACQQLAWLATWDYPGNPYRGNRAIKLRALTIAAIDLIMIDTLHEQNPQGSARADYLGGNLIWIGNTYRLCGDVLPADARSAMGDGLKKLARRIAGWGPTGLMTDMDLFAPVGLWYIQQATGDPEMARLARDYARRLFTEPAYFNSAGYFVDNGCFDTSYNGISLFFGSWAALMTDWPFAREALDQALKLRAHLCFPEPDGQSFSGPSAMSSRTSADPPHDQWQFDPRMQAAAMLSEEGLMSAKIPDDMTLSNATVGLINALNSSSGKPMALQTQAWAETHWGGSFQFSAVHCPEGHYAKLCRLRDKQSPFLRSPFLRNETFLRAFGEAFVIGCFPGYAFAVHTGPVGRSFGHNNLPYGYGGGQLSVFWTRDSGAVWLTRRRGVQGAVYDSWAEWRSWPVHAVSGCTAAGGLVTSTRIRQPVVERKLSRKKASITVQGAMPILDPPARAETDSGFKYRRVFTIDAGGIDVETTVTPSTNAVAVAELYETLPLFLREYAVHTAAVFQVQCAGKWQSAGPEQSFGGVTAIRAERFGGAMEISFDRPRALKFAPAWIDGFQTRGEACSALVNLLEFEPGRDGSRRVRYTIRPFSKKTGA